MTRRVLGAAFLVVQLALILRVQLGASDRYLAWAPLHESAKLRIEVRTARGRLTPDEVARRYGLRTMLYDAVRDEHWELNRTEHVLTTIEQVERAQGEPAHVRVRVQRNGHAPEVFEWGAP